MEGRRKRSSLFGNKHKEQQAGCILNVIEDLMEQQKRLEEVISNKRLPPTEHKCDLASVLKKKGVTFADVDNYASIAMSFRNKHAIFMENDKFMLDEIKQLNAEFIKRLQKCI
nr:PREDICTED: uncharacterized protein LOC103314889 [Tribolium castaneum]|eukprot:XP_008200301.1 PREDICTED: uncharacterized protein LOC103314889 [Tribolium castaneum]